MNFFSGFRAKFQKIVTCVAFFNQICENKSEICRKFWILWKLFTIIQNYSLVSLDLADRADRRDLEARVRRRLGPDHHAPRAVGRGGRGYGPLDAGLRSEVNNFE